MVCLRIVPVMLSTGKVACGVLWSSWYGGSVPFGKTAE